MNQIGKTVMGPAESCNHAVKQKEVDFGQPAA
jgi:hypothetical protein